MKKTEKVLTEKSCGSFAQLIEPEKAEELYNISKSVRYPFIECYKELEQNTFVHKGSLELAAISIGLNHEFCTPNLVVDGNLTVDGLIDWREENLGSFLFVTGNLKANSLIMYGCPNIYVRGKVEIESCICGTNGDNGGELVADGEVSAKLIICQLYFRMSFKQQPKAQVLAYDYDINFAANQKPDELSALLSSDVLDNGGSLKYSKLSDILKSGKDIFRNGQVKGDILKAADNGSFKLVQMLAQAGADVNVCNEKKKSVLHFAAEADNAEAIKVLVEKGADTEAKDKLLCTPLFMAAWLGRKKALKALIEAGANLNTPDNNKFTPLIMAAYSGRGEESLMLIEAGADIMAKDKYKQSAVQMASYAELTKVVEVLIAKGCPLNDKTHDGGTAIQWASEEGHLKIVEMLVAAGADPKIKNNKGQNAIDLAKEKKQHSVVSYLQNL